MHTSIIIPTRDHPELVAMAHDTVDAAGSDDVEVVFVDNGTTDPAARRLLRESPHRVLHAPIPFNFPRLMNRGVRACEGDVIVLLNNDVEARDEGWLLALLAPLSDRRVGVAGAVLEFPSGRIQHCGIGLVEGVPTHLHAGETWDQLPEREREALGEPMAVTAACMAVRRDLWDVLGGMRIPLAANYNDVDLCLRARMRGWGIACVPGLGLIHHESETRGDRMTVEIAADWLLFRSWWADETCARGS